jgi:glc operon protein GlcG
MQRRKNMPRLIRLGICSVATAAAFALIATGASAQSTDKSSIVMSPEMSKRTLTKDVISAETAEKIAHVCEDFATKHGYPGVIYIIDPFGDLVHVHRMDGTRPVQLDGAITKAKTALFYRANTHELADRIANNPVEQVNMWAHGFHPTPGGMPIVVDGKLIGVIGVTGSDPWDEECAYTGLHEVLGTPMPSPDKLKWPSVPPTQTQTQR